MPRRSLRPCSKPGCTELSRERYCPRHKQEVRRYDQYRESAAKRGYDARWRKARAMFLRSNPLCVECEKEGRLTPATVVDHIQPHRGNMRLFWDSENNWQALCATCHNRKTAREDGGFGNPVKKK